MKRRTKWILTVAFLAICGCYSSDVPSENSTGTVGQVKEVTFHVANMNEKLQIL